MVLSFVFKFPEKTIKEENESGTETKNDTDLKDNRIFKDIKFYALWVCFAIGTFNGLMAIPNIISLVALSGVAIRLTKDYLSKD